jgi:DNA-binding MarR family transcriptional regulator
MSSTVSKRQHAVKQALESLDPATPGRTAAGDALTRLVVRAMQLHGLLLEAGDALARPAGQTAARWQVLAAVEAEPRSVADIARRLNLARQSVQRVADLLVEDGLAAYADNPAHARAKLLALAPAGRAALRTIQAGQRRWADALGARMDVAQVQAACATLEQLAALLSARG